MSRMASTVMVCCFCAVSLSAGCTAFVPKRQVPAEGDLPAKFSLGDAVGDDTRRWWKDFESEELAALVDEAMRENLTLRQLWARLDQAGSVAVQAASGLYPQLEYAGDAGYTRTVTHVDVDKPSFKRQLRDAAVTGVTRGLNNVAQDLQGSDSGSSSSSGSSSGSLSGLSQTTDAEPRVVTETKRFNLSLVAGYEVDIWGRIYTQFRAAQLQVEASREDVEAAAITLAAEVTDRWLQILEQHELQRLLAEQLETNETYLELVEMRFRNGLVSALDVYQQRQVVSDVRRQIPRVQAAEQLLRQDLAVLLGKLPTTPLEIGEYELDLVPPLPPTGVPAELLLRRPDIRSAFARLSAAEFEVGSARADLLPALRLTGGIGTNTAEIRHLFDDWFISAAAGLAGPLFDGFRRTAEIDRTLAVVEQRLAEVRLTVLTAIREVEDALVQEARQREYLVALAEQLEAARSALREASSRYRKGLNDYLPVLAALERTQLLARATVVARREMLTFRLSLYRALGGTWTHDLASPSGMSGQPVAESKTETTDPNVAEPTAAEENAS